MQPLARALAGLDAWGSGVRRDEAETRRGTRVVDWDATRGAVEVDPLGVPGWGHDASPGPAR